MIGANSKAPIDRQSAVAGDQRLLITQVKGKTVAVLYEKVSADRRSVPVEFTSPVMSIRFAKVVDVSSKVQLAIGTEDGEKKAFQWGLFEFAIPLSELHLPDHPTGEIRGDIGILRGNGYETTQRVYWMNKATGLVSDLPSEADLRPSLWGRFTFKPVSPQK